MQTSPLFLGLIVAGVILVLGVVIVNWLQMRRARRSMSEGSHRPDPQSVDLKEAGGRVEPVLREGRSAPADADAVVGSIAIDEEPEAIDAVSADDAVAARSLRLPQPLPARAVLAALAPDPDIESVVMLRPPQPVPTSALVAAIPDVRPRKAGAMNFGPARPGACLAVARTRQQRAVDGGRRVPAARQSRRCGVAQRYRCLSGAGVASRPRIARVADPARCRRGSVVQ